MALGLPFVHPGALGSGPLHHVVGGIVKETLAALASAALAVASSAFIAVIRVTALGMPSPNHNRHIGHLSAGVLLVTSSKHPQW